MKRALWVLETRLPSAHYSTLLPEYVTAGPNEVLSAWPSQCDSKRAVDTPSQPQPASASWLTNGAPPERDAPQQALVEGHRNPLAVVPASVRGEEPWLTHRGDDDEGPTGAPAQASNRRGDFASADTALLC